MKFSDSHLYFIFSYTPTNSLIQFELRSSCSVDIYRLKKWHKMLLVIEQEEKNTVAIVFSTNHKIIVLLIFFFVFFLILYSLVFQSTKHVFFPKWRMKIIRHEWIPLCIFNMYLNATAALMSHTYPVLSYKSFKLHQYWFLKQFLRPCAHHLNYTWLISSLSISV